ncbi:zinc-binding dehydrogenase [Dendrosporobacter sp. 1207_IL3150]|uniref:zinc-binding dehydrogenase n=1 Tax=Dendrosporobacter sp. 1207_IL3150 TaxID=3084054 RepID=UPI002FDAB1E9
MNLMQALVKTAPDKIEFKMVAIPHCGPRDVLIRVKAAALCGTDLHICDWNSWAQGANIKLPLILGHECCGDVEAIGSDITTVKVGDKVASETHIPCGRCYQCFNGQQHICSNLKLFGIHMNGCFAEYAIIPEIGARKIPTAIPYELGAVMEPLGTALRAVHEAKVSGANVVVIGCGPIGLFAVASAAALGAATITATDISESRLETARRMGAQVTLNALQADIPKVIMEKISAGVDVIIEASGNAQAYEQSFHFLRKGGRMVLIGLPSKSVNLNLGKDVVFKEAEIIGIHGRKMFETWTQMENLLAAGKLNIKPAITHEFPLDQWQQGIALARDGRAGKVIFYP